ncbi:MAG TPA: O-antigen ligase family protein [Flavobacteriales bacterium]|nr:O-antigen ligase family protein [Flavobacteriales bacterium]HNU55749.1 O-antigen ligase family protein [Flavobacteriales bacterium]
MRLKDHKWLALAMSLAFVVVNMALMAKRIYWLNLLPVALILGWVMLTSVDKLLLAVAFFTPLSINLEELDIGGIGVSLPTEPIMVGLMVLFLFKLGMERGVLDVRVWKHPITLVILAQLAWMLLCIIPSSMPFVSAKYMLARLWFVVTMYFMVSRLFEEPRNVHRFMWCYIAGLSIVVCYTLVHHSLFGFEHEPAHWVMTPFFKDHTSYGAILAFFLPFCIGALTFPSYTPGERSAALLVFILLAVGLIFSYTRAAWLSLVGAFGLFLVMRLRVPTWVLAALLVTAGVVYVVEQEQITIALERNRDESSDDLGKHVSSISNISSDASNLERINRWNSALRMWEERPVFGWGPGTYMFQYAPFQASEDRTIISTNFAAGGNAHSEYLGPLSEQGVPGMLLMVMLVGVTLYHAIKLYARMPAGGDRRLVMTTTLGLVTYYLHGVLNNFLDLDKASVPFWAFTVLIVLIDIRYPRSTGHQVKAVRPDPGIT